MESQTSLIRSDRTVELYTETVIYLNLPLIIYPRNTELDNSFRNGQSLQQSIFFICFFIRFDDNAERFQYLFYCLMKFRLCGIFCYYQFIDFINI